jgi:hypothetical protein
MNNNHLKHWFWKPAKAWQFWLPGSGYIGGLIFCALGLWIFNLLLMVFLGNYP